MGDCILQTAGLTKKYPHTVALDNVSVRLERGGIYGFIGQNGAGKTTFMRVAAGLCLPDGGEIYLFGESGKKGLAAQRKRLGCMIEYPALYPYMDAHDNLEALRLAQGLPNKEAVENCLRAAGLADAGRKKVQHFSLGMKQRLGIAAAMLGEPELLLLDEPANGLDPVSIVELRGLLQGLAGERQLTILVSSHILGEMYQLASHYIFLHQGKVLQQITKEELDRRCKKHIAIRLDDAALGAVVLERVLNTQNYTVLPDKSIQLYDYTEDMQRVIAALADKGLAIENIGLAGDSLEDYFMNIIRGARHA